jgi:hypothetical protein
MHAHASHFTRLLGVLMLALAGSANAQSGLQSYDVELIVFRTLSSTATPENWQLGSRTAPAAPQAAPDDSQDAEASIAPLPSAPTMTFPALPAGKFKLTALTDTLRRSRNYQPIVHFGWTQPGYPRGDARYMSIDGLVPPGSGLSGQVALARGRYLHLTLELTYETANGERMVMRQTRRMRSNERHYFDHPAFGVIAIITPAAP